MSNKDWIVTSAVMLPWGQVRLEGINLNYDERSPNRRFAWNFDQGYVFTQHERYDFSRAVVDPEVTKLAARKNIALQ